jgi:hypothetical protein
MESHDPFDDEIRSLVRSVGPGIPPDLERTILESPALSRPRPGQRPVRWPLVMTSLAGAAILLLSILALGPARRGRESAPIAEILTEFEVADGTIKIIFVQKPDFPVLLTSF